MVNAGAIATTSLAPGATVEAAWAFLTDGLARFAGRPLPLDEEVYASASATNHRNRAIANLLESHGGLGRDRHRAGRDGRHPGRRRGQPADPGAGGGRGRLPLRPGRDATAGMYETSGDWLYDVGVPGKSGIGGGIVVVAPGKGALGTFALPLDPFGNSVKGQLAARFLAHRLGLSLFVSEAEG